MQVCSTQDVAYHCLTGNCRFMLVHLLMHYAASFEEVHNSFNSLHGVANHVVFLSKVTYLTVAFRARGLGHDGLIYHWNVNISCLCQCSPLVSCKTSGNVARPRINRVNTQERILVDGTMRIDLPVQTRLSKSHRTRCCKLRTSRPYQRQGLRIGWQQHRKAILFRAPFYQSALTCQTFL